MDGEGGSKKAGPEAVRSSPVNVSPVADPDHKNLQDTVLNVGDNAVIADTVFPIPSQYGASQRFTGAAGVIEWSHVLVQEAKDPDRDLAVEAAQIVLCRIGNFNPPRHSS